LGIIHTICLAEIASIQSDEVNTYPGSLN